METPRKPLNKYRHAVPLDEEGHIDESTLKLPKVMFCQTRKAYLIKTNC
jgi:hypothetical protein